MLSESVDSRLKTADPSNGVARFSGYPSGAAQDKFRPNPLFWAKDVDFSCASPWNSQCGAFRAGTLVSKRHVIFAKHFPVGEGARMSFVDNEGRVCACRIVKMKPIKSADIMVGLLDYEVTPNIHPAKILPVDYERYLGDCDRLPIATFNKREELTVSDWRPPPTNVVWYAARGKEPTDARRFAFRCWAVPGDSGNPAFFIAGREPILLYTLQGGMYGAGSSMHVFRREIQAAMDELCPGYKLEVFDFSQVKNEK